MTQQAPDDELTRTLARAGIDITAEQHARLTDAMRASSSAGMPAGPLDVLRALDRPDPIRHRVYVPDSQFRGTCQECGSQFMLDKLGNVSRHMDDRKGAVFSQGKFRRARCVGSGRPPG